jgi:hypothetical protein
MAPKGTLGDTQSHVAQPAVAATLQIGGHVMAQSKGRDAVSLSDMNAGGFLVSEAKRVETAKEVQKQLLDTFEQFNRQQLVRAKEEVELASECAGKMTSASSVPDVMNAYQNWISKRLALYVEDGRKLFEDSQRALNTTMKLLGRRNTISAYGKSALHHQPKPKPVR